MWKFAVSVAVYVAISFAVKWSGMAAEWAFFVGALYGGISYAMTTHREG